MKSTINGKLNIIPECTIIVPVFEKENSSQGILGKRTEIIRLNNLPDISDSKSAIYNQEGILGRSAPIYTYSHSSDRSINMQLHFFIVEPGDGVKNLEYLRILQSAIYPSYSEHTPYQPPPVCKIRCGKLLGEDDLCVILQSYSVKFPTEVAWEEKTYCPFRFDVDTNWTVVYDSSSLPFQHNIANKVIVSTRP